MAQLICRTCLGTQSPDNCVMLQENDEFTSSNLFQMLNFCVPELDMYVVLDPVICENCVKNLRTAFDFKSRCIQTEEKVTNHLYMNMMNQNNHQNNIKVDLKSLISQNNSPNHEQSDIKPKTEVRLEDIIIKTEPESSISTQTSFECINCKGCQLQSSDPTYHVRVPTSIYECHDCSKTNVRIEDFRKHMESHIKRHQCNLCQKRFRHPSNLGVHMRRHTGEKPFECRFCSKKFQQSYALVEHERNHTEPTSYRCEECLRLCSSRYNLRIHKKYYCKVKKLEEFCGVCGNGYTSKPSLKRHMMMQHKDCVSV